MLKRISDDRIARLCIKQLAWDRPVSEKDMERVKVLFDTQLEASQKEEDTVVAGIFGQLEAYNGSYIDKRFWHSRFYRTLKQCMLGGK